MWVLSMELASCRPSGAENFKVASRFLENLCPTALDHKHYQLMTILLSKKIGKAYVCHSSALVTKM